MNSKKAKWFVPAVLSIFLVSIFSLFGNAQKTPVISWTTSLSSNSKDTIWCVKQTKDSGYILCGSTVSGRYSGTSDFWVVKVNKAGTLVWQKTYGGSGEDVAKSVCQAYNGNLIVAGYSNSNDGEVGVNNGGYDTWILRLDSLGNKIADQVYGGSSDDKVNAVIQLNSGNYVVIGSSNSTDGFTPGLSNKNLGGFDVWIFEINPYSAVVWSKNLGGTGNDFANSLIQTKDGGFLIAGASISSNGDVTSNSKGTIITSSTGTDSAVNSYNYWVVKANNAGTIQWQKSIGNTPTDNYDYDVAYSANTTFDGGYIVAGNTGVVKLDKSGNQVWKNNHFTSNNLNGIQLAIQTRDSSAFAIASNGGLYTLDTLNKTSKIIETATSTGLGAINSFQLTKDSGYIAIGNSSVNGSPEILKIHLDKVTGSSTAGSPGTTYTPVPSATPSAPVIASFTGSQYSYGIGLSSGDVTTIKGKNFLNVSSVSFGINAASSFSVVDDNTITATVGKISYPGYVTVTSNNGITGSSITKYYQKGLPVFNNFTGTSGRFGTYIATGDVITITGKYLSDVTTVTFGGDAATNITLVNDTAIKVTVGAVTVDSGYIVLSTASGLKTVSKTKFYHGIIIKSFPSAGIYGYFPGDELLIKGKCFTNATVKIVTYYGGNHGLPQFSNITIENDSTIKATVGSGGSSGLGYFTVATKGAEHFIPDTSSRFYYCPGVPAPKNPIIMASSNNITAGTAVTFSDTVSRYDTSGSIYSYLWQYIDTSGINLSFVGYFDGNTFSQKYSTLTNDVLQNGDQVFVTVTATNCLTDHEGYYNYNGYGISTTTTASDTITMSVSGTLLDYTWTGRYGANWKDSTNWSNNLLPSDTSNITITAFPTTSPIISDTVVVNDLNINSSIYFGGESSLTVNGKLKNHWSNGFRRNYFNSYSPSFYSYGYNGYYVYLNGKRDMNVGDTNLFIIEYANKVELNGDSLSHFRIISDSLLIKGNNVSLLDNNSNVNFLINTGNRDTVSGVVWLNLTQNAGSLHLNNLNLPSGSLVAPVSGTITGTATVWKYVPWWGNREFRDFGAGVANAGSIFNNWQQKGGNYQSNIFGIPYPGIFITGSKNTTSYAYSYDKTNGLDVTLTGNPSMYTYNNSNKAWSAVTNTINTNLDPYIGYRVLVRGDRRDFNYLYNEKNNTMWSDANIPTTGNLITGKVTYSTSGVTNSKYPSTNCKLTANGYSFVANPYHSPVSWSKVLADSKNINTSYWYQDPTLYNLSSDSGYTQTGITYVTYNSVSRTSSNSKSYVDDNLQPGQAFFVQSTSASPSLVFNESSKIVEGYHNDIFGKPAPFSKIALSLNKAGYNLDGAVCVFNNGFNKAIGVEDSWKFANSGENIALNESGKDLAINGLPSPCVGDSINIHLFNLKANTTYKLKLDASNYIDNGLKTFIKDNLLNTIQELSADSTLIAFTTTSNDTASYANRYSILFSNILPISTINVFAFAKGKNAIVNWTITGVEDGLKSLVQHSINGVDFTDVYTEQLIGASAKKYIFTDVNAANGSNYYRIKLINKKGEVEYSKVVMVAISDNNKDNNKIIIYPNPVAGNKISINMADLVTGSYRLSVVNTLGEKIIVKQINHTVGNTEGITLDKKLPAGNYILDIINKEGVHTSCSIEMN